MSRAPRRPASADEIGVTTKANVVPRSSPHGAMVLVLAGPRKGQAFPLPDGSGDAITLGASRENDVVLADPTVSRRHLRFRRLDDGLVVEDLGSTNGTFVESVRVREATVGPGSLVRAGDVELVIALEVDAGARIPPSPRPHFGLALGESLAMRRIFGVLERMAPTSSTIVLWGETGTGKDVLARSIHLGSERAGGPFEVVDCGAVSATLIESELFGHERGAFTGAVAGRAGAFERAAGGTLFLDEIGELALELQPKLLRVLEAREFKRLGGNKTLTSDARIVAATTQNLQQAVKDGTFREDLYFRLTVISIHVPPLRERREDILPLAKRLLAAGPARFEVSDRVAAMLCAHDWPGNVRELRNVMERAMHVSAASGSEDLVLVDFPPSPSPAAGREVSVFPESYSEELSYGEVRAAYDQAFERSYVGWLLTRFDGNIAAAARAVRMDRKHLADLARRFDLQRPGGRAKGR